MFRFLILLSLLQAKIMTLEVASFEKKLFSDSVLIDVRTPKEFKEGHIKGAINVSVTSDDFSAIINEFPKDRPIFVYCRSGKRSTRAVNEIKTMGFPRIIELAGGFNAWVKAKQTTE